MEHKTFPAFQVKLDAAQGLVTHSVAVFGNVDLGDDRIHPGAFVKTITERSGKIRVLNAHQTERLNDVIGKPVKLWEVDATGLPPELLARFPQATGALMAQTQFLMDTPEGAGAFSRIANGAVDEYSIGYDALDTDYTTEMIDGEEKQVRNIRTVRLWEYSPCIFAMNPATSTLSAKATAGPGEGKPYDVFREGDKWRVYKVGEDGKPTGDALGEHDTEEEARRQQRALYAAENSTGGKEVMADYPWDQCMEDQMARYGDEETARRVCGAIRANSSAGVSLETARAQAEDYLKISPPKSRERATDLPLVNPDQMRDGAAATSHASTKAGRVLAARNAARIRAAMETLIEIMQDAGLWESAPEPPADEEPDETESDQPTKQQAGPGIPPTSYGLADIEKELRELQLMEVTYGLQ